MRPYYSESGITIYHGDNREVLRTLDVEVDLVFTSPPYNLGSSPSGPAEKAAFYTPSRSGKSGTKWTRWREWGYGVHSDSMPIVQYEEWQRLVLSECWRLLSHRGAIFYNHKPRILFGESWLPLRLNPELPLRQVIIWDAGTPGVALGMRHFAPRVEWQLLFAKSGYKVSYTASSGGDLWSIPMDKNAGDHPAPFPEALPARALRASEPGLVLDPHAGAGTTLMAAHLLGWRAIGIEIEERYCEIAAKRLSQGVLFAEVDVE